MMQKKIFFQLLFLFLFSVSEAKEMYLYEGAAMGTYFTVKIYSNKKVEFEPLIKELKNLEEKFSDYIPNSEIARINKMAGEDYIKVSEETILILEKSIQLSELSNSAFDPTVGPLIKLWGFKNDKFNYPSVREISLKLNLIGFQNILIDKDRVFLKNKGMSLDLGAIAKGYTADKIVSVLRKSGLDNAIVEIGGDMFCLGSGKELKGWLIGIRHPQKAGEIIAAINVSDKAVATSGDYENYFFYNGIKYPHIIDPRTGYPVKNGVVSVTVVSDEGLKSDGWATALFVLGWEDAKRIVESKKDLEAVIIREIDNKFQCWASSGIREKIEFYEN